MSDVSLGKWTRGPWEAITGAVVQQETGQVIARCEASTGESEANALLCATAPEMVEVCMYVHNFVEGLLLDGKFDGMDGGMVKVQAQTVLSQADAVLARVCGRCGPRKR
jgi:hypothetical protein